MTDSSCFLAGDGEKKSLSELWKNRMYASVQEDLAEAVLAEADLEVALEVMGVVPVHIGDIDVRPFKNQIDWESCSFYFEDPFEAVRVLKRCSEEKLLDMGNQAARIYKDIFSDDHWCGYLLCELSGGGRESSKQEEKS